MWVCSNRFVIDLSNWLGSYCDKYINHCAVKSIIKIKFQYADTSYLPSPFCAAKDYYILKTSKNVGIAGKL